MNHTEELLRPPLHYTPEQAAKFSASLKGSLELGLDPMAAAMAARDVAEGVKLPASKQRHVRKPVRADDDGVTIPEGCYALDLMETPMPEIHYSCDPWIPEGLTLLVGRPKLGKSTFARQKLAAVAGGGDLFGAPCVQGKAAFLSLEENDRQTKHKLAMARFPDAALANLLLFFSWKRGTDGVLQLARLLDEDVSIKYVVIDSLTRFRAVPDARQQAFSADYEAVSALQGLCKRRPGISIEAIHHTRKTKSDDPLDDISGTFGLSAACDSYQVMRPHEDGAVLFVGGRLWDREESKFELRRASQRWELVGEFSGLTGAQQATLEQLRASGGQTPTDAAKFWNVTRQSMMDRFAALIRHGVAYSKDGVYHAK